MFVFNVLKLAKIGTVITWARPGQIGHHHVNLKTNEYVKNKMKCVGFEYDDYNTTVLRGSVTTCGWLRFTTMVFRKKMYIWDDYLTFKQVYNNCSV